MIIRLLNSPEITRETPGINVSEDNGKVENMQTTMEVGENQGGEKNIGAKIDNPLFVHDEAVDACNTAIIAPRVEEAINAENHGPTVLGRVSTNVGRLPTEGEN